MLFQILLRGLALTGIVSAGIAVLAGSVMLSHWIFMGDDPWDGRFRGAAACYFIASVFFMGLGWSGLAVIVAYFAA
jgi:hypothetical protein